MAKEIRNKEIVIWVLTAIVIFFMIILILQLNGLTGSKVTGKVIQRYICEDNDGGVNFAVLGQVKYQDLRKDDFPQYYDDSCDIFGRNRVEYYCGSSLFGSKLASATMPCKNGCVDGQCIMDDAQEKCYIKLEIGENKKDGIVKYSLNNLQPLYGNYNLDVQDYYPEESTLSLTMKDGSGNALNRFALQSSRFIFWDDFSNDEMTGGVEELDDGIIEAVIPFDYDITGLEVNDGGALTTLSLKYPIRCLRTCKNEDEVGIWGRDECCLNLEQMPLIDDGNMFACTRCGNGICSGYENKYYCPEDCK